MNNSLVVAYNWCQEGRCLMLIVEIKDKNGLTVKVITADVKTFKTGSRGFYGMDKAEIDGKRYQIQFQAVEIGSKTRVSGDTEEPSK